MKKHIFWLLVGFLCLLFIFFGLRGCNSSNTPKWAMHGVNAQELAIAGNSNPEPNPSNQPAQGASSPTSTEEAAQTAKPSQAPTATSASAGEEATDTSPVVEVIGENTSTVEGQPEEEMPNESEDKPASTSEQASTPENADRELRVIKPYMRGDDVRILQDMLIAKGYDPGKADGIYGPKTERSVKLFQSAEKLYGESDALFGIVDEATWRMLRGGEAQ